MLLHSTRPSHSCPSASKLTRTTLTRSVDCFKTTTKRSVFSTHSRRRLPLPPSASSSPSESSRPENYPIGPRSEWKLEDRDGDPEWNAVEYALKSFKKMMADSLAAEDYKEAAVYRDKIEYLEKMSPEITLNKELKAAVEAEDYETAAQIRDKLRVIEAKKPPPAPPTSSSITTNGIRVDCQSYIVRSRTKAREGLYYFSYKITITNVSNPALVKLKSRYWSIMDGNRRVHEVRGPGVIGEEPELQPGESFEYMSACPLPTEKGTMEGNYEFYSYSPKMKSWNTSFLVEIAKFGLSASNSPPHQ